jgi:hypothetical protein
MKLRYLSLVIAGMAITGNSYAQYANDALRFSQTQYGSTARFTGLGNAGTAVGGDLSSIGTNPAGLGLFSKSEFSFTPEFSGYSAKSSYLGLSTNAEKDKLNISNASLAWVMRTHKAQGSDLSKGLLSLNFGIGYNKTNDFANQIIYSGTNPTNSIADFYADLTNNGGYGAPTSSNPPDGSLERGAYEGYLTDYFGGKYVPDTDVKNKQTKSEDRNGSQSEFNISAGANISNKLFLGASVGILSLNYSSSSTFNEKGYSFGYQSNYDTNYLQNYNTNGSGINAKLGIIYKPVPFLRLGASAQTPSWYSINDSYSEMISTSLSASSSKSALNVDNDRQYYNFSYKLKTPARYNVGAALFNNSIGFISGEVEFVDYNSILLSSSNSSDEDVILDNNQQIASNFSKTMNYKIGGELKASSNVMLRAGYNLLGSASDQQTNNRFKTSIYSGGAGYRFSNCYLDFTVQHVSYDTEFQPYVLNTANASGPAPTAAVANARNNVFMTFGMRF